MDGDIAAVTAGLLISAAGNIGALFYWAGKLKTKVESVENGVKDVADDVKSLDSDNKEAHKTIYSSQEATGRAVVKIEEHLSSLNGSVNRNTNSIESCKTEIHKNTERIFTHTHKKDE